MNALQAIIEHADWAAIRWGLVAPDPGTVRALPRDPAGPFWQVDRWYPYRRTRPDAQTLGSCAWNTIAVIREIWDAVAGLPPRQRNYDEAYRRYRVGRFGVFEDKGSAPEDMIPWCRNLELFPPNTVYTEVALSPQALCAALEKGPLWAGQALHPGWTPSKLSKYGEVDHTELRNINPNAGHAMSISGTNIRATGARMIARDQSWGPLGYEDNGQVWEMVEDFIYAALCKPILIIPDLEAIRSAPVPEWW